MAFKNEIEVIVDRYVNEFEEYVNNTDKLLKEGNEKQEIMKKDALLSQINEQINAFDEHYNSQAVNQNNLLQVVIEKEKEKQFPSNPSKQKDEDGMQVADAIKFLELEGEDLTDDIAYSILKHFEHDYDQMKLFKRMIGRLTDLEDISGNTKFPKTLGTFNQKEYMINTFEMIEQFAEKLFLHPISKDQGRGQVIYSNTFHLPGRNYEQRMSEKKVIELAAEIDGISTTIKDR